MTVIYVQTDNPDEVKTLRVTVSIVGARGMSRTETRETQITWSGMGVVTIDAGPQDIQSVQVEEIPF
jgi:hypothetical protein